ncbi:MAG: asparaginase [Actinomycetota bacterium]
MTVSVPLVRVVRSGFQESVHTGDVAVCDADGRVVAAAGDPHRALFSRSSMKPLQAAVSLTAMGAEEHLSPAQVAVMCASHNGEPIHVQTVRSVLERAGLDVGDLRCPPDYPLDQDAAARAGERRRELHNCSGKHAGKLLACVRAGWDTGSYLDPDHPLQQRILAAVRVGTGIDDPRVGVDGCGAPVHGVTLAAMATLFARLARPERLGDLEPSARRAVDSMLAEPYLVAGRNRLGTALMEATGSVIEKGGAEGLSCAAVLPAGLGIAVKAADGSHRATAPAMVAVLRQLDVLDDALVEALRPFARPPVLGGGLPVGEIEPLVELLRP